MTRSGNPIRPSKVMLAMLTVSLALFSSPALSKQLPSAIAGNELETILALRQIAAAQSAFQQAVEIDSDCDRIGEFGFFAELAGTQPMRVGIPGMGVPAPGVWGVDELSPPLLRSYFGVVRASSTRHSGYDFQMWLPGPQIGGKVGAIEEDCFGGKLAGPFPASNTGAKHWCCYAWPETYGLTGRAAYFINEHGQVFRCSNRSVTPFTGGTNTPRFDEAFQVAGDMSSPIRVGIPGGAAGSRWNLVP